MRRLFFSSLGANLFVRFINLITGLISARLLGPYGRGELAAATRWTGLFALIFTVGLPGAVIVLGKQFPDKQKEYFGAYLVVGSLIGLIGFGFGEMLVPELFAKQPSSLVGIAQIAMLAVPLGVVADGLIGTLQTLNKFPQIIRLRIAGEVGTFALILVLIAFRSYGVRTFLIGNTLWALGTFVLTLLLATRAIQPSISNLIKNSIQLLNKGIRIYMGAIASMLGGNLDQLVLSLLLGPYTLGLYSVAASIGGILPAILSGAIGIYLWPKLMDIPLGERRHQIERIHSSLLYGTLILCAVGGVLLPIMLPLMYGGRYSAALLITEIFLLSAPVNMAYMVITYLHSTTDGFSIITIAEIMGLLVGLAVTIPLLHVWEGAGAALGVFIAVSAKWLLVAVAARKQGITWIGLFRPHTEGVTMMLQSMRRVFTNRIQTAQITWWTKR